MRVDHSDSACAGTEAAILITSQQQVDNPLCTAIQHSFVVVALRTAAVKAEHPPALQHLPAVVCSPRPSLRHRV